MIFARAIVLVAGLLMIAVACRSEAEGLDTSEPRLAAQGSVSASTSTLPHATDFLTAGCPTLLYAGLGDRRRAECRRAMTSRGYTHFYLYAYNELDFGGPAFNYYASPQRFRAFLLELRNAGLEPVVWLAPDDAPVLARVAVDSVGALFDRFVPAVDDLVSSYVLGLELDEYWPASAVDRLGSRVAQLTSKPVAVHQTPGRWDFCRLAWCDYMVLQYGFDAGLQDIDRMTRAAIGELGKPVVAGEYEVEVETRAVERGNRGVGAGAAGFGNGGTPGRASVPRDSAVADTT